MSKEFRYVRLLQYKPSIAMMKNKTEKLTFVGPSKKEGLAVDIHESVLIKFACFARRTTQCIETLELNQDLYVIQVQ